MTNPRKTLRGYTPTAEERRALLLASVDAAFLAILA
jgi:hypothetical protein